MIRHKVDWALEFGCRIVVASSFATPAFDTSGKGSPESHPANSSYGRFSEMLSAPRRVISDERQKNWPNSGRPERPTSDLTSVRFNGEVDVCQHPFERFHEYRTQRRGRVHPSKARGSAEIRHRTSCMRQPSLLRKERTYRGSAFFKSCAVSLR